MSLRLILFKQAEFIPSMFDVHQLLLRSDLPLLASGRDRGVALKLDNNNYLGIAGFRNSGIEGILSNSMMVLTNIKIISKSLNS